MEQADPYQYSSLPAYRSVPAEALRQALARSASTSHTQAYQAPTPGPGPTTRQRSGSDSTSERRRSASFGGNVPVAVPSPGLQQPISPMLPSPYRSASYSSQADSRFGAGGPPNSYGWVSSETKTQQLERPRPQGRAQSLEPLNDFLSKPFRPEVIYGLPAPNDQVRRTSSTSSGKRRFLCCIPRNEDEGYH